MRSRNTMLAQACLGPADTSNQVPIELIWYPPSESGKPALRLSKDLIL